MKSPYPWGTALSAGAIVYGILNFALLPYWLCSFWWLRWTWVAGVASYLAAMKFRKGVDTMLV